LDWAEEDPEELEISSGDRSTGNSDFMAAQTIQAILVEVVAVGKGRASAPYVPFSHPFVERLIGTIRREHLDRTLFWTTEDLETKLFDFQRYYNEYRAHAALSGRTPEPSPKERRSFSLSSYRWHRHCRGLYQTPAAA
jgi:hypothetical protein